MRRFIPCCFLLALVVSAPAHAHTMVNVGITLGNAPPPPVIVFRGEPHLILVPTTGVSYYDGPGEYDYFSYGSYYYIYNDNYWYRARQSRGPFIAIREAYVPRAFYGLHDRGYHWKHGWKRVPPGQVRKVERREREHEYKGGKGHKGGHKHDKD
jgi:hypothetical protein